MKEETNKDKLMFLDKGADEVIMSPEIITETFNSNASKTIHRLNDLFLMFDKIPEEVRKQNLFRVRFYVLRVDPFDIRESVQSLCP